MRALFRPHPGADWADCEILGTDGLNYIVREVGKVWPGVAITPHVRVPAGEQNDLRAVSRVTVAMPIGKDVA